MTKQLRQWGMIMLIGYRLAAIIEAYARTLVELYDDPEMLRANPFFAQLRPFLPIYC